MTFISDKQQQLQQHLYIHGRNEVYRHHRSGLTVATPGKGKQQSKQ